MRKVVYSIISIIIILNLITCSNIKNMVSSNFNLEDGYSWKSDLEENKVYRIDNTDQLKDFINTEEEIGTLDIDFDKKTLLLVPVMKPNPGYKVISEMKKEGNTLYLNIILQDSGTIQIAMIVVDHLALLVDKIPSDAIIKLDIQNKSN